MERLRLNKNLLSFAAAAASIAAGVFFTGAPATARQAGGVNLFQDVMSHKATISWQSAPATNYPQDACDVISACSSDGSAPKVLVIPTATVDGRKVARAVYLVKVKDAKNPEAVVFEHRPPAPPIFSASRPTAASPPSPTSHAAPTGFRSPAATARPLPPSRKTQPIGTRSWPRASNFIRGRLAQVRF